MQLEALQSEVLRLPTWERAQLLDRVVASLDADHARSAAWDALAAERERLLADGTATERPLDEVLATLRTQLQ